MPRGADQVTWKIAALRVAISLEEARACLVADSPNITRCVMGKYGPAARPDWRELLAKVRRLGTVNMARAVVNPGLPGYASDQFERAGYCVARSLGPDCDELVIGALVKAAVSSDVTVLAGGDHIYTDAILLARQAGRRVIVVGVPGSCARILTEAAHEVWEMPIYYRGVGEARVIAMNSRTSIRMAG
jgi:hypothetical protein